MIIALIGTASRIHFMNSKSVKLSLYWNIYESNCRFRNIIDV